MKRLAALAVQALLWPLELLPMGASLRLARLYTAALDRVVPRLRRTGERNLDLAGYPVDQHKAILDGLYRSLARVLVVLAKMPEINAGNVGQWIEYQGLDHFTRGLERGKGVLFATAHLGNWELSAFAHALMSGPMHVVVRPLDDPYLDAFVERRRALSGNRISGKRDAARTILQALRSNQAVGILIDQNCALEEGVFVDFFGVKACTHATFAKLAARTGATVIPGFAIWDESIGRHVLRFDPPVEMDNDLAASTQRLQAHLESVIRQYPEQWLWIHRRWKTRPPGEPGLY